MMRHTLMVNLKIILLGILFSFCFSALANLLGFALQSPFTWLVRSLMGIGGVLLGAWIFTRKVGGNIFSGLMMGAGYAWISIALAQFVTRTVQMPATPNEVLSVYFVGGVPAMLAGFLGALLAVISGKLKSARG